jgi:hypothetical protein
LNQQLYVNPTNFFLKEVFHENLSIVKNFFGVNEPRLFRNSCRGGINKIYLPRGDLDWKSTFIAGQNNWERNTFLHFTSGKLILNQDSDFDTRLNHIPAYLKRFFNNKKIPKVFDISRLSTVKVIPN